MPIEVTRYYNGSLDIAIYSRYHQLVEEIIISKNIIENESLI